MPYGYEIYRAESRPSPALQREADRQLGQFFAALSRLRPRRARPVRPLRRPAGLSTGDRRVRVSVDTGSQCLAALVVPVLAAPEAGERTRLNRA
jgi:hypothetical protein